VNPPGDWRTQAGDPSLLVNALGLEIVKQRVAEGDMEALFSLGGYMLKAEAGAVGRTPQVQVGLAVC
jgi:hypothetical protein